MRKAQEIIVRNQGCCSKLHGCVHESHGGDGLQTRNSIRLHVLECQERTEAVAHGDDFATLGYEDQLDWFKREMDRKCEPKHRGRKRNENIE